MKMVVLGEEGEEEGGGGGGGEGTLNKDEDRVTDEAL